MRRIRLLLIEAFQSFHGALTEWRSAGRTPTVVRRRDPWNRPKLRLYHQDRLAEATFAACQWT